MSQLTPKILHTFGHIITQYARIESGLRYYISAILNISPVDAAILTAPYGVTDYRNVMRALNELHPLPKNGSETLVQLLGDFKTHSRIRNQIAHCMWGAGERENSVKPKGLDIRGKLDFYGHMDGEDDYTLDDLQDICRKLDKLHGRFIEFYANHGYAEVIAAVRTLDINDTTSE